MVNRFMNDLAQLSFVVDALDDINLRWYTQQPEFKAAIFAARIQAVAAQNILREIFIDAADQSEASASDDEL